MPTVIQDIRAGQSTVTSAATITATGNYTSNTTAGSLLICLVTSQTFQFTPTAVPTPTISLPTTSGFTWTQAVTSHYDSTRDGASNFAMGDAFFYLYNASSMNSTLTTTVGAAVSGGTTYTFEIDFMLYEVTGMGSGTVNATAFTNNGASGTIPSAGLITTTVNSLIMVSAESGVSIPHAAGTGFALRQSSGTGVAAIENGDPIPTVPGTYTAQFGATLSHPWSALATAFGVASVATIAAFGSQPILIGF